MFFSGMQPSFNTQDISLPGIIDICPPHKFRESSLHPEKIPIWCVISRCCIAGPIFFMKTVTAEVYRKIISQFITLFKQDERDSFFQKDEAPPHTSQETLTFLAEFFGDRVILKGLWPPHSTDLSPSDFFLMRHLKNTTFKSKVPTINKLKLWQLHLQC